jgi:integrase
MSKNNGLILRGDTWHMRFSIKGVKVAETTHTSNKRDAEMILAKRKAELIQDVVLDNKRIVNFHDALDQYVNTRATESSKRNAKYSMVLFKTIPNKAMKLVDRQEIHGVIEKQKAGGAKPSTVAIRIRYWNAFVNWCVAEKYHNCGKIANLKDISGKTRWLTAEEQRKLLAALDPSKPYISPTPFKTQCKQDNYDLVIVLLDTGVRFMEAASMTWNQVDMDRGYVYVDRLKNGINTTLTMTTRLKEVLTRRRAYHDHLIFPTKDGKNKSANWMNAAVKRAGLSTAQGNITPHVCRHTYAATMIQNGVSLTEVQHLLGHKNIAMTQRYAHFIKQDAANKAADILNTINAKVIPESVSV